MRLAVIVPARNAEKIILRCLESLAQGQRRPDLIVVADNGSHDGTCARVKQAAVELPCPVKLVFAATPGPAAARNAALQALDAQTDVVAMLDADCVAAPDWLEQIELFFQNQPQAVGLGGVTWGYHPVTWVQKFIALQRCHYGRGRTGRWIASGQELFHGTLVDTNNAAFRRAALVAVGGFDEALCVLEDADLSVRVLAQGGRLFISYPHMRVYHEDPASWHRYLFKFWWYCRDEQKVFKKHFGRVWVLKLPWWGTRIIRCGLGGGIIHFDFLLLPAAVLAVWFCPWAALSMAALHFGIWSVRLWPSLRHPKLAFSPVWLPWFWICFMGLRLLGRGARCWGGLRYRYWVI